MDCFNDTWDLLEKEDRTQEEDRQMVHMAHASRYHWGEIGTPLNFARGDWQISRVYAILGLGEIALIFAKSSLQFCIDHGYGDFDLAFAYEAAARAYATLGDLDSTKEFLSLATEAGNSILKDDDKKHLFKELRTITIEK